MNQTLSLNPWESQARASYLQNSVAVLNITSTALSNVLGTNTVNASVSQLNWCQPGGPSATVEGGPGLHCMATFRNGPLSPAPPKFYRECTLEHAVQNLSATMRLHPRLWCGQGGPR